ncbi:MAG: hypothetical protein J5J06_17835 [Phycisphaerae bacterium]|nr:hypothetical protein [Phycisphaerae bacterium]
MVQGGEVALAEEDEGNVLEHAIAEIFRIVGPSSGSLTRWAAQIRELAAASGADPVAELRARSAALKAADPASFRIGVLLHRWASLAPFSAQAARTFPGMTVSIDPATCRHKNRGEIVGRVECSACGADLGPVPTQEGGKR